MQNPSDGSTAEAQVQQILSIVSILQGQKPNQRSQSEVPPHNPQSQPTTKCETPIAREPQVPSSSSTATIGPVQQFTSSPTSITSTNMELPQPVEQQHFSPPPLTTNIIESPRSIQHYPPPSSAGVISTTGNSNVIDLDEGYTARIPDCSTPAQQILIQQVPYHSTVDYPVKIQQYSSPPPPTQAQDHLSQSLQSLHLTDGATVREKSPSPLVRRDTQSERSEEFVDAQEG